MSIEKVGTRWSRFLYYIGLSNKAPIVVVNEIPITRSMVEDPAYEESVRRMAEAMTNMPDRERVILNGKLVQGSFNTLFAPGLRKTFHDRE